MQYIAILIVYIYMRLMKDMPPGVLAGLSWKPTCQDFNHRPTVCIYRIQETQLTDIFIYYIRKDVFIISYHLSSCCSTALIHFKSSYALERSL